MVSSLKFYGRSSETTVFETYTPHILHCNEYRSGKTHMTHNDATNFMLIICDFQGVLGPMDFWLHWGGVRPSTRTSEVHELLGPELLRCQHDWLFGFWRYQCGVAIPRECRWEERLIIMTLFWENVRWWGLCILGDMLEVVTPDEYMYETVWKSVKNRDSFTFQVKACGDAHVILSNEIGRR